MATGYEPVVVRAGSPNGPIILQFDPTDINGVGQSDTFVESLQWLFASQSPWASIPAGSVFRNVVDLNGHRIWQGYASIAQLVGNVLANPLVFPIDVGYRAYTPAQLALAEKAATKYNAAGGRLNPHYASLIAAAAKSGVDPRGTTAPADEDPR